MLTVSMGALISLAVIMLVCFVMPFALFYVLYRYADGKVKTLLFGAAAYLACGVIIDTLIATLLDMIGGINSNAVLYLLYAVVLSPAFFILVNYFIIKRFGADNIKTTGDSMMYSLGYSSAFNILSTGLISVMYFLTLLDIRNRSGQFLVVSDADYISMTDVVSKSSLVTETIYAEMQELCATPTMYFVSMCLERLWLIVVYSAVILVIWLAVRKSVSAAGTWLLLAAALGMRGLAGLPNVLAALGTLKAGAASALLIAAILLIDVAAAVVCWRKMTDE